MPGGESLRAKEPTPVVFVVDDDAAVREALGALLRSAGYRVELFATPVDLVVRPLSDAPDCLVLDVDLPGLSGLDLQRRLTDADWDTPIVFITGRGDIPMSVQAMKAGAVEFLTKPVSEPVLLSAVEQAVDRRHAARRVRVDLHELRELHSRLTPRELDVMALVAKGLLNKQIAGALGISEVTVKQHRGQVMRKMRAGSIADLVKMVGKLDAGH
jgi:FixJ family two-component response regulator